MKFILYLCLYTIMSNLYKQKLDIMLFITHKYKYNIKQISQISFFKEFIWTLSTHASNQSTDKKKIFFLFQRAITFKDEFYKEFTFQNRNQNHNQKKIKVNQEKKNCQNEYFRVISKIS